MSEERRISSTFDVPLRSRISKAYIEWSDWRHRPTALTQGSSSRDSDPLTATRLASPNRGHSVAPACDGEPRALP